MANFSSLATAVSGLRAAQTGLAVTGHNMANSEILGYARQRVTQKDFFYKDAGMSLNGNMKMVGLGTDTNAIMQIRNKFLDITYRNLNTKLNFYAVKSTTGAIVEDILGEMQGAYRFQSVINDIWNAMQELSVHPEGIETRDKFLATCEIFVNKANEVYESLFAYQLNLDRQIRATVDEINELVTRVNQLNTLIRANEAAGDYANDYRDERNLCLDKLSALVPIDYYEDTYGNISIFTDGHQLLNQNSQHFMGLKYVSGMYSFVEPVFTSSKEILPSDTPPNQYEAYVKLHKPINAYNNNDDGALKALIISRGAMPATYRGADMLVMPVDPGPLATQQQKNDYLAALHTYNFNKWSVENCLIPKVQMQVDLIVNKIVTMINDAVAPYLADRTKDPDAPYDLRGSQSYVEIFVRKDVPRFDPITGLYNTEDVPLNLGEVTTYYSQYSIGNIKLNPLLLDSEDGFNLMPFSPSPFADRDDNRIILDLLHKWRSNDPENGVLINGLYYRIQDAYQQLVTQFAIEIEEADNFLTNTAIQVNEADYKRQSIMSVSLDEELRNMMTYQYAYQSAARILNTIDSMIDRVVNGMGRVGL